ncbi:SpaA isopeptide-forming pilin-related protein [Holdemanella sp.]|uniref:MSCRAMM family protein n=1 Tax=Holdemanella sp. TaxID=1971762 RepID=UPI00258989F8|nr:SpaA isopeptide-forming pilin-related protein [Holdemanella sp.]
MKKFKNVFLAFFVTALTSLNLVLPAYAEETTTPTVDSAGFSVNVVGDGTVTLSSGDFTKTLSNGDTFNANYEEGTEIKIVSKSNENAVIDDVSLNNSTISGFTSGKKSFSFVYTTKTADANFSVTFKTKETQKTESSTSDKTTSEQSSVQNEDSNTSEDETSNDAVTESEDADKYGTFDVDLSKMDIDTSKTVYTKYLYAIPSAVSENDTITSALIDKDPKDTIYTQTMEPSTVYTDGDAYYIQADTPFVNGLAKKSYPYDYDVARGNDYGQQLTEGFSYDKKTHILKIDKDVFKTVAKEAKTDNNPKEDFSDLQVQFLVPADVENDVKVKTTVVDKTGSIDSVVGDSISLRPFMTTRFQLASEKTASNIIPKNVKVYVNGSDVPLESEYGAYDPETGEMALSYMGASLKSLEIVVSKSKGRAVGVGLGTAKVGSINVLAYLAEGTKDVFNVGSSIDVVGKFGNNSYVQTIDGPLELYNKSRTTAGGYFNTVDWNDGDGGECTYTDSALAVPQSITMNGQTVDFTMRDINGNSYGQWVNGGNGLTDISDPVAFNGAIQAFCHHIKQAVGTINENSRYALRYPTCTLRVLDASTIDGYRHVVFGFETNLHHFGGSTPQTVGTVFELAFKVQSKGKLCIKKTSANPAITENNPCYSLQGAEYGVYKTEADAKANKNKVNTLTIGKYDSSEKYKDWSNEVELDEGTYYVKETKNPKGYALNNSVVKVTIKANENSWIGTNGEFKDYPQADPVGILLGKVDKETNKNKPQGSASLAGAEFTVKYYKGLYDSDPAKSGQIPARSWVLKTDKDGFAYLDSDYKVSGDDFYMFGNIATIPVGTITIQETKAPTGYFINNEVFVRKIEANGKDQYVSTYNQPTVNEKVIKFDIKKVQAGTSTPVAGAVFRHTLPNGSTEDLETNGSGEITITGLASGTHKIKEIKSPDGYQLNPNEVVFNVASGTGKITFTSGTNSLVTHGTKDSGDGYATFADKVNPFNLKITKTNEHGKVLKGAEFRLYSDADCKNVVDTQISDEKGLLTFKNLDVEKTYYFKETKAPQGYRIPVDENGNAYVHSVYVKATPQTNTFEFTVDGIKYDTSKTSGNVRLEGSKKDRVVAVDITNKTTQLLPETGSNGTILLIGLGVAVIAFALYKSKKDKMISK